VRLFARLFASYVADLGLAFFTTGGVTISGGILRTIAPFFQHPSVRDAFEQKAPMTDILRKMSFRLALMEDATLRGMTVLAQSPEYFGVDLDGRCWNQIP
jgi:glucokinase